MARFDVYRDPEGRGFLLDVQAGVMGHLNTRVVVPLLPASEAPKPAKGLNPEFKIAGVAVVMVTQFLAAIPTSALKDQVGTLDRHHDMIVDAIDLLLQGF